MDKISYVGNADVNAIEYLYEQYRQNPENVDLSLNKFLLGCTVMYYKNKIKTYGKVQFFKQP